MRGGVWPSQGLHRKKEHSVLREDMLLQRLVVPSFKLDSVFIFKFLAKAGTKVALGFSELPPGSHIALKTETPQMLTGHPSEKEL